MITEVKKELKKDISMTNSKEKKLKIWLMSFLDFQDEKQVLYRFYKARLLLKLL